ncbi:MAG: DUF1848 domain-containing protein [Bacteroidales bacterium]|nr:DUF1848 domain-containing protein [Bacteroidales bacterium]
MIWKKVNIKLQEKSLKATAPVIISASRATDIPAFYAKEFMKQFRKGYLYKKNPFNGKKELISFKNTRLIVFWTKFAEAILPYLDELDEKNIHYYFQFTLNDYKKHNLEPYVPSLEKRIESFIKLSDKIGKEKVIWRFDPVILLKNETSEELINRIENIARRLFPFTEKMVFSFADFSYRKVQNKFRKAQVDHIALSDNEKHKFSQQLAEQLQKYKLKISTCAQKIDLSAYGITHNKCIDDELIIRLFPKDKVLMNFIKPYLGTKKLKDKGQRKYCGCIYSKDIGTYNTCSYLCLYCYAVSSKEAVEKNKIFS